VTHSGGAAIPSELLAELERLRKLEERLKSEHSRMQADARTEISRLHAALRETADRVKERELEIERLTAELDGRHGETEPGPASSLLLRLEQDRRALEERARAVAETEARQREAQAKLTAEKERLAELGRTIAAAGPSDPGGRPQDEAIRQKEGEPGRTAVAPPSPPAAPASSTPSQRERELARREEELTRREVELRLLGKKIGEAELRLAERAWRAGAFSAGDDAPERAASTFVEGIRSLGSRKRFVTGDGGSGSW
jgi:hypothetical protein